MQIESALNLKPFNTFGLPAVAQRLARITSQEDVMRVLEYPGLSTNPHFILGGGSNIILTRDVPATVLKVEIMGKRLLREEDHAWVVEAGAGENWHAFVCWTLAQGWGGLENMALIPGTVGATPVQNIGAYGVELQDRFDSLDAVDLSTGRSVTLDSPMCGFDYRDSIFKHGSARRYLITRVRFRLPKPWMPVLGYLELERKMLETKQRQPTAHQVAQWVTDIRRSKLPDPQFIGNAGSFFKNPVVTLEQCTDIIGRDPGVVHYPLHNGTVKMAAAWLIDACGWRGKTLGRAGVYEKQALVLVNKGGATGSEVLALAGLIQESVYGRFGLRLEMEPVVV